MSIHDVFSALSDLALVHVYQFLFSEPLLKAWSAKSFPPLLGHELLSLRLLSRSLGRLLDGAVEAIHVCSIVGARRLAFTGRSRFPRLQLIQSPLWKALAASGEAAVEEVDDGCAIDLSFDGELDPSRHGLGPNTEIHKRVVALPEMAMDAFFSVYLASSSSDLSSVPDLAHACRVLFSQAMTEEWSLPTSPHDVDSIEDWRQVLVSLLKALCITCCDLIEQAAATVAATAVAEGEGGGGRARATRRGKA